jgi:hypothetical protein
MQILRKSSGRLGEHTWLVTFMDHDLGPFDDETWRREPVRFPVGLTLVPVCPEYLLRSHPQCAYGANAFRMCEE